MALPVPPPCILTVQHISHSNESTRITVATQYLKSITNIGQIELGTMATHPNQSDKAKALPSSACQTVTAEPRYLVSSTDVSIFQASTECWNDILPFPQNGNNPEDRNDAEWMKFLCRLGLQRDVYPTNLQVHGKVHRPGKVHGGSRTPDWK